MPSFKGSKNNAAQTPGKWVIVQLSPAGEREQNLSIFERSIHRILGKKLEVFVPAISQKVRDESHTLYYIDGYVFVKYVDGVEYGKLSDTNYFTCVLTSGKVYRLLDDKEMTPLRKGVEDMKVGVLKEGDSAKVVKGTYKNLIGKVSFVYQGKDQVQLHINLSSKQILIDFPSTYLVKVEQNV